MKTKHWLDILFVMLIVLLAASCQNSVEEQKVQKHEVEIKPIDIKMQVDVNVNVQKAEEEIEEKSDK